MNKKIFDIEDIDIAWCPGCGNFGIRNILIETLAELEIKPKNLVIVSGIGQAAKIPHYINCNTFNGLHGRALPPAVAIKAVNPELVVIAESGDGDMYGEGGNHFIHTIRRNPDITHIVHNNMVYGLTKGQASPTSRPGFKTPVQVDGVFEAPFNPIAVAVALDASFVARAFCGDIEATVAIVKRAVQHRGYALVDILQPCVTFNKVNNFTWYKKRCYKLPEDYSPTSWETALKTAMEWEEKIPIGVLYKNERPAFDDRLPALKMKPPGGKELDKAELKKVIDAYK